MSLCLDPKKVAITPSGERYHKIIWNAHATLLGKDRVATRCGLDSMFNTSLSVVSWEDVPWEPCKVCYGKGAKKRSEH